MRLKVNSKFKTGFTFLEVLIAIAIVSVGLVPMIRILPESFILSTNKERITKVIFLVERKMEEIHGKAMNDFNTGRNEAATTFTFPYSEYKYIVTDNNNLNIKDISVSVWHDDNNDGVMDSNEESIILYTKIADRS